MAGEETAARGRKRSRWAQILITPLLPRVSLLLVVLDRAIRVTPHPFDLLGVSPSLAARARTQALNLSVKPEGWVSRRRSATRDRHLLP